MRLSDGDWELERNKEKRGDCGRTEEKKWGERSREGAGRGKQPDSITGVRKHADLIGIKGA